MSAREKIENLTNTWYGFYVCSAIASVLVGGRGLITGAIGLFIALLTTFIIGRRLLSKGHITRVLLLIVAGISTLGGAYNAAQATWTFVHAWELSFVVSAISSAVGAWMMAKSFRVLTDSSVKTYFA